MTSESESVIKCSKITPKSVRTFSKITQTRQQIYMIYYMILAYTTSILKAARGRDTAAPEYSCILLHYIKISSSFLFYSNIQSASSHSAGPFYQISGDWDFGSLLCGKCGPRVVFATPEDRKLLQKPTFRV